MLNVGELKQLMEHADDDLELVAQVGEKGAVARFGVTGIWVKGDKGDERLF